MSGHDREVETELDRDIGIVGAIALGMGTMIAAGIFVLSGLAVSNVGAMAIGAFVIAAIVASFTAFAYAEFAAIYPESGGGYTYVANTFDSNITYIVGWSMILGYPASAAFYLASFSTWFHEFIAPLFDIQAASPFWASGFVILGLLVLLNLRGTEESGQFQIVVTALKVALIVVFLFGGLQAFDADVIRGSITEHLTMFRDIGVTSALVFITFFGFEAIATNAEEIEDPGRTIPRAIFISMGLVTVIYALVVLVITLSVNNDVFMNTFLPTVAELGGQPAVDFIAANGEKAMAYAAQFYLGDVGFYVIIVGALFSMLSAANATILAGSRVKLAMSRRNHLPSRFEKLHDSLNTPYFAVLLTGGLIAFFIAFFTIIFGGGPEGESILHLPFSMPLIGDEIHMGVSAIAHFADFMLLMGLIVVNFAVIRSRRKYPDIDRAFTVPAVPYVPIVAILANLVLLVNVEPGSFLIGVIAELVGIGLWFGVIQRGATDDIETEAPKVIAERSPEDREYELLVPIANPDHVPQLMRTARDVAADRNGHIHVLSVVQVPEQTPLTRGRERTDEQREVLERAMAIEEGGAGEEVPVNGSVRIAHHVDDAILHSIRESGSDAVLMGWHGDGGARDRVLGNIVDEVVEDADCDVLVERMGAESRPESILVPTAGGTHAAYAADVAGSLARSTGAAVEIVSVLGPDAPPSERRRVTNTLERTEKLLGEDVEFSSELLEDDEVVDAIVERSGDHDLTVVGATREGLFQQLVFGSVPEAVGRDADGTVIMAKRNLGLRSRLRSTIERLFGH